MRSPGFLASLVAAAIVSGSVVALGAAAISDASLQTPPDANVQTEKPQDKKPATDAGAVVGKWRLFISAPGFGQGSVLEIKADEKDKNGKKILGTLEGRQLGDIPFKGEFSKGKVKFSISIDTGNVPLDIDFEGKLKEDGTLAGSAILGPMGELDWTAKRIDDGGRPASGDTPHQPPM